MRWAAIYAATMSTRAASLRVPHLLVLAGLVGVVVGAIVQARTFEGLRFGSALIIYLAVPFGYCLVGLAWWQLLTPGTSADPAVTKRLRRFSRTLAVASTVTAACYLAQVYGDLRFRYSWPVDQGDFFVRHFRTEVACPAVIGVGLLLAAAGFWIASNIAEPADSTSGDSNMVGVGP